MSIALTCHDFQPTVPGKVHCDLCTWYRKCSATADIQCAGLTSSYQKTVINITFNGVQFQEMQ